MFKSSVRTHRTRTVCAGIGLAACAVVAVTFAFGLTTSSPGASADASPSVSATTPPPQRTTLSALSAQGMSLPKEMSLYIPSPADSGSAVTQTAAIASAQRFYPFVKLGDAQLLLMTDDQIQSPRLVWIVTVLDKPTFVGGPVGADTPPDTTRPTYWLVFVDAHTGEALFGQSGQKLD